MFISMNLSSPKYFMGVAITIAVLLTLCINSTLAVSPTASDWPDTITLSNKLVPIGTVNSSGYTISDGNPNMGGEWTKSTEYTGDGNIVYTKTLPNGSVFWWQLGIDSSGVNGQFGYYGDGATGGWPEFFTVWFGGPDLNNLIPSQVDANVYGENETMFRSWVSNNLTSGLGTLVAGGISQDGATFLTGGDPGSLPPTGSMTQAQMICIGLEFNNGQWTVAQ